MTCKEIAIKILENSIVRFNEAYLKYNNVKLIKKRVVDLAVNYFDKKNKQVSLGEPVSYIYLFRSSQEYLQHTQLRDCLDDVKRQTGGWIREFKYCISGGDFDLLNNIIINNHDSDDYLDVLIRIIERSSLQGRNKYEYFEKLGEKLNIK